jgi:hypothetical protein
MGYFQKAKFSLNKLNQAVLYPGRARKDTGCGDIQVQEGMGVEQASTIWHSADAPIETPVRKYREAVFLR